MIAKVQKWGNSLGIRIPKVFAREVCVGEGAEVKLLVEDGRLVVEPLRPQQCNLDELLRGITPQNLHGEVRFGRPAGREVW